MAEATLNFDEKGIDKSSSLYELYNRFYEGMCAAGMVDVPDFTTNPPLTASGEVDISLIDKKLSEYSTILIKNSAYMMANSIVTTISAGSGGGSAGLGYLMRNGDNMAGRLGALHGFQAGYDNQLIFETIIDEADKKEACISGHLLVDENISIGGRLDLGNDGIYISGMNILNYSSNLLTISSAEMHLDGNVVVAGNFRLGIITMNNNGLFHGNDEYYYKGNCNVEDVDWQMCNGHVYGFLKVDGEATFNNMFTAVNGFELGAGEEKLFYSAHRNDGASDLQFAADLNLLAGYGLKFSDRNIIKVRGGSGNIVSFSAPGMILNLGDSDGELATSKIALQAGIYNYSGDYQVVSQFGDGNFPNSLSAGCGNSGPVVLQTYYKSEDDCGVVLKKKVRLGSESGPSIDSRTNKDLNIEAPFVHMENSSEQTDYVRSSLSCKPTTSLFKDTGLEWSASLHFDTEGEFFTFNKPVEATNFSIISEKYKTRLLENALLLGDGIFLEGVPDGILHNGEAYFSTGTGSVKFASGFAGYGWNISENKLYGGISATFDELTIRRKMRVYELEVQKSTVTNGSFWVSDSCAGDDVEEIL